MELLAAGGDADQCDALCKSASHLRKASTHANPMKPNPTLRTSLQSPVGLVEIDRLPSHLEFSQLEFVTHLPDYTCPVV